jgi:hypothetical protein
LLSFSADELEVMVANAKKFNDFHTAVGQYLHYRLGFQYNDWHRQLYLAVPSEIYNTEFSKPLFQDSIHIHQIKIIVYNTDP